MNVLLSLEISGIPGTTSKRTSETEVIGITIKLRSDSEVPATSSFKLRNGIPCSVLKLMNASGI
jgi:hypothetical protein